MRKQKKVSLAAWCAIVSFCTALATPSAHAQRESSCTRGRPNAPVRLDIFSDFECPICRAFFERTMRSVFTDYADTGKACVIYWDFPLKKHEHAVEAARYGRAAMRLGADLWTKTASALFATQKQWSADGNVDAALASALSPAEMAAIRKQLDEHSTLGDEVADGVVEGLRFEVADVPTVVITTAGKSETVEGALKYSALKQRIEALLQRGE